MPFHLTCSFQCVDLAISNRAFSGTGSARAALLSHSGEIIATFTQETKTFRNASDANIFEQSTTDIWNSISKCTHEVLKASGINASQVKGVGFDATCSLAVSDLQGNPVTVTGGSDLGNLGERNVILWADHRAWKEAKFINSTGSEVLKYVGGTMSVCLLLYLQFLAVDMLLTCSLIAGDGDTEDFMVEESYGCRSLRSLPVL